MKNLQLKIPLVVEKYRKVLVITVVTAVIILLPFAAWNAVMYASETAKILLNGTLVIYFASYIIFCTVNGVKILKLYKGMSTPKEVFITKVYFYAYFINGV